jgi:hypothetical protein
MPRRKKQQGGKPAWDRRLDDWLMASPIVIAIIGIMWVALIATLFRDMLYDKIGLWIAIPVFIFALPFIYLEIKAIWKRQKTGRAKIDIDKYIQEALRKMDSIGGVFTDEESANQQLCLLLREYTPGADVRLVQIGRGMGDIRVGNTIIEGKLDLVTKDELDRLIGQLQDYYDNSSHQIRVVVYGKLRPEFRQRIESLRGYYDRILLHHVEGVKRRKATHEHYVVLPQGHEEYNEDSPSKPKAKAQKKTLGEAISDWATKDPHPGRSVIRFLGLDDKPKKKYKRRKKKSKLDW